MTAEHLEALEGIMANKLRVSAQNGTLLVVVGGVYFHAVLQDWVEITSQTEVQEWMSVMAAEDKQLPSLLEHFVTEVRRDPPGRHKPASVQDYQLAPELWHYLDEKILRERIIALGDTQTLTPELVSALRRYKEKVEAKDDKAN